MTLERSVLVEPSFRGVSSEQERLCLLAQVPFRPPHLLHIGAALTTDVAIHPRDMRAALRRLVSRHSALRTAFQTERGHLLRSIATVDDLALPFEAEVSGLTGVRHEERVRDSFKELISQPFDLMVAPLWRLRLVRGRARNEHAILLVAHHAITDYRSLAVMLEELMSDLAGSKAHVGGDAPADRVGEIDADEAALAEFIRLQAQASTAERLDFWRRKLRDVPPYAPPATLHATATFLPLSPEVVARVREWGNEKRTRASLIYLTAFECLLREHAEAQEFLIAMPIDSRFDSGKRDAIGLLSIPTLFRSSRTPAATPEAAVRAASSEFAAIFGHRHTPVAHLASILRRSGGRGAPFAPFFFTYVRERRGRMGETPLQRIQIAPDHSEFAVSLTIQNDGDRALAELVCQAESAMGRDVRRVGERFVELILELVGSRRSLPVASPSRAVAQSVNTQPIRFALAASFVADPLAQLIEGWGSVLQRRLVVNLAPYNQVVQQLLDSASVLHAPETSHIILLVRLIDMVQVRSDGGIEDQDVRELVDSIVRGIERVVRATGKPVLVGLPPVPDHPDAPLAAHTARLETDLNGLAGVTLLGRDAWQRCYPLQQIFDPEAERLGCVPYTDEFYVALATILVRTWHSQEMSPVKAIAVDGDNVLWGGILGEDGVDGVTLEPGHLALHRVLVAMADAGVILCLASKNDPEIVRQFFTRRADSVLRWESFVVHKIDWQPKPESLHQLAAELGLGLDAMLFLDDSPAEVAEVRDRCPRMLAIQMPEASAMASFLDHLWLLDRGPATPDDRNRIRRINDEQKRRALICEVGNHAAFIEKLRVQVRLLALSAETVARAAQLTVRTNQFNFTTTRRTEAELVAMLERNDHFAWTIDVEDRFGDYGKSGVVIATVEDRRLIVHDFLLSCRVLGRGVEHQVLAFLGREARTLGALTLALRVLPTARNIPAQRFAVSLGALLNSSKDTLELILDTAAAEVVTLDASSAPGDPPAGETTVEIAALPDDAATSWIARDEIATHIAHSLTTVADIAAEIVGQRSPHVRSATAVNGTFQPRPQVDAAITDRLRDAWRDLLGVHFIPEDADFFALGGDSIRAVRLLAAIHAWSGVRLDLNNFLTHPTFSHLAAMLIGPRAAEPTELDLHGILMADVEQAAAHLISPPRGARVAEHPEVVLVTGATGFVGSSLLVEIARRSSARIVALVRGRDGADAMARLRAAFVRFSLPWSEVLAERVRIEVGDLAAPQLGLADKSYEQLAGEVDWIYHAGARVDFLLAYRDLKRINVDGTTAILALATHRRLKAVHHISTLGIFHGPNHAGAIEIAETEAPNDGASLPLGYLHSKWVAERVIARARKRDIPVSVYRLGTVTGCADSPRFSARDFFVALTAASQDIGALPDMHYVDMVPVDYVARAIWIISSGVAVRRPGIFHLAHPAPPRVDDLARWARWAGTPMTVLPVAAWIAEARKLLDRRSDHSLAAFGNLLVEHDPKRNLLHLLAEAGPVQTVNTVAALAEAGVVCPRIDRALLGKYYDAMRSAGLIGSPFAGSAEKDLLWFAETMFGSCVPVPGSGDGKISTASLRARVSIQSIQQLVSERRLFLTGIFTCDLLDASPIEITSGSMQLRPWGGLTLDGDSEQIFIAYDLALCARDGRRYRLRGNKIARPGLQIWRETRTLDIAITREEEPDRPILRGRLEIPARSYVDDQVFGMRVNPRLPAGQRLQIKAAWMAFLGLNIGQTYLGVNGNWLVRNFLHG